MFWICGITRRWLGNALVTWLASYKVTTLVAHLLCWQKLIRENVAIWTPFGFSCSKKLDIKKQINLLASFSGHDIKVANNKDFCRGTRISKSWRGKACPFVDLHWIFEISSLKTQVRWTGFAVLNWGGHFKQSTMVIYYHYETFKSLSQYTSMQVTFPNLSQPLSEMIMQI